MRLITFSLAAALAMGACAQETQPDAADPVPAESPAPASATPSPSTPAPSEPATPAPSDDCGAAERQDWIGRARSDLPSAPAGATWRVYETGQPVTMDFSANRLNIEIDPTSQKVVRLSCG